MSSMKSLGTIITPPHSCSYLPEENATLRYDFVEQLTGEEYEQLMLEGWRRFGYSIFRPQCESCQGCRSLRVDASRFRMNQSQKRAWKRNLGVITVSIGPPSVCDEKLALYDRYHQFQHDHVGWRDRPPKDADDYLEAFVENPFPTQEWTYRIDNKLLGVGYVDDLPSGPSAIYFYYDPEERNRSLGVFNVLSILNHAQKLQKPFVYLGFFVEGCRSLEYKANFCPNQLLTTDGHWRTYRDKDLGKI
jgi:leucyl-tRNA---protein transferase